MGFTHDGLKAFLAGGLPQEAAVITPNQLYKNEERLGIGRDNSTRTTVEGLLYQTRHVRPEQNVAIGLVVKGLPNMPAMQQGLGRLGAEGRLAAWIRKPVQELPTGEIKNEHLLLMLVTHAQFTQGWLPDGLQQVRTERSQTVWEGTLHGVRLRLLCCVVGKPVREGGWDLVQRAPRTMDSLVPAGSCYFFEVLQGDAKALHGKHIGLDTDYGRGEIAVGTW